MASLIPESASVNPNTAAWQANLLKITKIGGGAIETARLTNWDTTAEPLMAKGSRFEINGSYYEVAPDDEAITGWAAIADGATAYVYATPGSGTSAFSYSSTAPAWDSAKGGWYNGTARALFRLVRTSATVYSNKCLMRNGKTSELLDEAAARAAADATEVLNRNNAIAIEAAARASADSAEAAARIAGDANIPTFNTVGSYAFLARRSSTDNMPELLPGAVISTSGGILKFAGIDVNGGVQSISSPAPSGNWMCMGYMPFVAVNITNAALFVRVS